MVRRSLVGKITGAIVGAVLGAALGLVVLGPLGAVLGALFGAVAGLALGDALAADKRGLSAEELAEARLVFGDTMNYDKVRIAEAPVMAFPHYARTPRNTVYFPPGASKMPFERFMPWLVHELTHVWQTQHGASVARKLFYAIQGPRAYDYSGKFGMARKEEALADAFSKGKRFADFNTEQQGDILKDYYRKLKAGEDTTGYEPFVAEVKGRTRPVIVFPDETKTT